MRDNYNAITPLRRKFVVVMGDDVSGWAVYDIDTTSEAAARIIAQRRELMRQRMFQLEKRNGSVQSK